MAKSAYEKVYENLKKAIQKTDVSGWDGFFAFQFTVTGDAAGTFYAKFEKGDSKITVENFDYQDNTATFKAAADTFTALVEGKLAPADAIKSGALIVEGDAGCADIFNAIAPKAAKPAKAAKAAKTEKAEKPAKAVKAVKAEKAEKAEKAAPAKKAEAPKAEAKPAAVKAEAPKAEAKKPGRKPAAKK